MRGSIQGDLVLTSGASGIPHRLIAFANRGRPVRGRRDLGITVFRVHKCSGVAGRAMDGTRGSVAMLAGFE